MTILDLIQDVRDSHRQKKAQEFSDKNPDFINFFYSRETFEHYSKTFESSKAEADLAENRTAQAEKFFLNLKFKYPLDFDFSAHPSSYAKFILDSGKCFTGFVKGSCPEKALNVLEYAHRCALPNDEWLDYVKRILENNPKVLSTQQFKDDISSLASRIDQAQNFYSNNKDDLIEKICDFVGKYDDIGFVGEPPEYN